MSRTAWFNCFAGVAGDMALGALIDAGAPEDGIRDLLRTLEVPGWSLRTETVQREGITATKAHVDVTDEASSRTYVDIRDLIQAARLPERVEQRSLAVFTHLGEVEAAIHGTSLDEVHFHEVGGHDAIVDIVGTCIALELLDIETIACSSIAQGTGTIKAAHGVMPNPAPATVGLLRDMPVHGVEQPFELTTPTGAALMSSLSTHRGAMPPMSINSSGFGAGGRELDEMANCTQVVIGQVVGNPKQAVVLETNVDDVTGEVIAYTVERLMHAGADDAWVTPIVMKKGRPAHTVSVLTDASRWKELRQILVTELGTFGTRSYEVSKQPVTRSFSEVALESGAVQMKIASHRSKPEYEEAAEIARCTGVPLREVLANAQSAHSRTTH